MSKSALQTASAIGDDRLQRQTQGYVVPDAFTHGASGTTNPLVYDRPEIWTSRELRHISRLSRSDKTSEIRKMKSEILYALPARALARLSDVQN